MEFGADLGIGFGAKLATILLCRVHFSRPFFGCFLMVPPEARDRDESDSSQAPPPDWKVLGSQWEDNRRG